MFNTENILNKKILITDDFLIIDKQEIKWDQISGVRERGNNILSKVHYKFPFFDVYLNNGKVRRVSNLYDFIIKK